MLKKHVGALILLVISLSIKTGVGVFEPHIQIAADAAAKKDANLALTHIQIASDAIAKKDADQALNNYRAASELIAHSHAQLFLNIAKLCDYKGELEQAIVSYKSCLALEPNNVIAMRGYADCLIKEGKLLDAIAILDTCVRVAHLNKDATNAYYSGEDLFKLFLKSGQFKKARAMKSIKSWWYDENISGKSILLEVDAGGNGFGDMFQYVRYAKILKEMGARVTVKVRQTLNPLLSLCPYIDRIVNQMPDVSTFHKNYGICIATLMVLTHEDIDYEAPHAYLYASNELQELWRKKVDSTQLNVGLCWEASPNLDGLTKQVILNTRSIHAKELSALKGMSGIRFFSLQKQIKNKPDINITYCGDDFDVSHGAFMDSAALIKNLDVVITVDTSIAHLAGALGVQTWMLLPADCDWRWLEDSTHTSWYPTMRLFRQKKYGDWAAVIAEIKNELIKLQ